MYQTWFIGKRTEKEKTYSSPNGFVSSLTHTERIKSYPCHFSFYSSSKVLHSTSTLGGARLHALWKRHYLSAKWRCAESANLKNWASRAATAATGTAHDCTWKEGMLKNYLWRPIWDLLPNGPRRIETILSHRKHDSFDVHGRRLISFPRQPGQPPQICLDHLADIAMTQSFLLKHDMPSWRAEKRLKAVTKTNTKTPSFFPKHTRKQAENHYFLGPLVKQRTNKNRNVCLATSDFVWMRLDGVSSQLKDLCYTLPHPEKGESGPVLAVLSNA